MYINFKIAEKYGVCPEHLIILQAIKQNRVEDNSDLLFHVLVPEVESFFEEKGWINFVKPKKKSDTKFNCVRLSDKAKDVLELIEVPDVEPDDAVMCDHLCMIYLKQGQVIADRNGEENNRSIGNKKKVLMYIAQFRKIVGLTIHEMYYLCELYVRESIYTLILERIFFDSNKNRYGKFKDNIEDSKLFQFYEENKPRVESYWKQKIK